MTTTLPLFWHLSSANKKERIDASVKLIGALEQFQAQVVPKHSSGTSSEEEEEAEVHVSKRDGLDVMNAPDVSYAIRRLIRGLASPRESSRLGFAVALTELLSRIETVTCAQIVTLIVDSTKSQGSMTGQEERDVLFARLFGLMSVIQSGLLVREGSLPASGSSATLNSTFESYEDVVNQLVQLGEKKSWLRESAWFTISMAIDVLQDSPIQWKDAAVDKTFDILFSEKEAWSPEKIALAAKLQSLYPTRDWRAYLIPPFKNADLLSSANLQSIARILKESTADDETKSMPKLLRGSWKPQLHFVWDVLLDQLLPGPNSTHSGKGSFQEFFRVVVDESLFSATSSPQRKYWGFQVFQRALKRVTRDNIPMLFTQNFMRSWINHLSNRDRYLHKIAQQTANEVQAFVQSNPQLGFALTLQLTGANGSQKFDRVTKTKTVETILSSTDIEGIKNYIDHLFSQANQPDSDEKCDMQVINSRRSWVIEQLGALIRNSRIPKSDEWIKAILDWLIVHGLFVVKKKSAKSPFQPVHSVPRPAFSDELRQTCRSRLLTCLGDLTAQTTVTKSGDKLVKSSAVASDGEFWVSKVLTTIQQLEQDTKHVTLLSEVDEETKKIRQKATEVITRLNGVKDQTQESLKGAELLICAMNLKSYCADEDEDADLINLKTCTEGASRLFPKESKKGTRKSISNPDTPSDEPIDVLVDLIIGFLEKSTAYMRSIGNHAFSLLCESSKKSTIELIVAQLERRNGAELLEDDDDDGDELMEDAQEEDDKNESDEAESSEEAIDFDFDDDGDETDAELRDKIEEALRVNGIEPATGDTDEEDDVDQMDDDQMMAIDEQLAQVFRSRVNEKRSGKNVDAQREATHFKNRVLDLVDTFMRKQPSNPFIILLLPPLVELVAGTGQDERQLADKAKGIIRNRLGKPKDLPSALDVKEVSDLLGNLHIQARKAHTADLLSILSLTILYLTKILTNLNAEESVTQIYRGSLVDFITRKNSGLNASYFQDFIRRFPTLGWRLREDLVDLTGRAVNVYRQCQAIHLLEVLVSQIPAMGDCSEEIISFMPSLRKILLQIATDACTTGALTAAQIRELLKLAVIGVRQTQIVAPSKVVEDIWQPDSWTSLRRTMTSSDRFKSSVVIQKMCEQIARNSQATSTPTKSPDKSASAATAAPKRKAPEVAEGSESTGQRKKTRRKKDTGANDN